MGIYTIHLKAGLAAELAANPEGVGDGELLGVKIIRAGFSWAAFIFGPLWLIWHRLWLALAAYALFFAFVWGVPWLDEYVASNPFAVILAHLFVGLEAHSLREWKLGRSGFRLTDIVVAMDADEAARRFFKKALNKGNGRVQNRSAAALLSSRRRGIYSAEHDVLGLFPQPEL